MTFCRSAISCSVVVARHWPQERACTLAPTNRRVGGRYPGRLLTGAAGTCLASRIQHFLVRLLVGANKEDWWALFSCRPLSLDETVCTSAEALPLGSPGRAKRRKVFLALPPHEAGSMAPRLGLRGRLFTPRLEMETGGRASEGCSAGWPVP